MEIIKPIAESTEQPTLTTSNGDTIYKIIFEDGQLGYCNESGLAIHPNNIISKPKEIVVQDNKKDIEINLINEIKILSIKMIMEYDETHNGGSFSLEDGKMIIGIKCIKEDPLYILGIISHEVMEAILAGMGGRYISPREEGRYLFNFDHQTFENAIELHIDIMSKFIQ